MWEVISFFGGRFKVCAPHGMHVLDRRCRSMEDALRYIAALEELTGKEIDFFLS